MVKSTIYLMGYCLTTNIMGKLLKPYSAQRSDRGLSIDVNMDIRNIPIFRKQARASSGSFAYTQVTKPCALLNHAW